MWPSNLNEVSVPPQRTHAPTHARTSRTLTLTHTYMLTRNTHTYIHAHAHASMHTYVLIRMVKHRISIVSIVITP